MQTNNIKISICMTTRNRARFIGETLENVISQANDNIEIVIVDGASTDNTREVVQGFKHKFSNLVYYRGEKNYGVDRDMATCIEMARGEYCWLLSDDDLLKPGAIERVLREIESGYEIYLCNVTACSLSMQPIKERFWLSREVKDKVFEIHDENGLIEYCGKANSLGALFSFWSSTILRRQEWLKTGFNKDFDGTAYAVASTLLSFIKRKCRLKYIRSSLVLWRNDNASFQNEGGLVKRFLLDFDGYLKLAERFLSDSPEAKSAFLKVMTREHPWHTIIHVTSCIDDPEEWRQFRAKMFRFGYSPRMATVCYVLGRFKRLVYLGVKVKRKIVKNYRLQKIAEFFRGH